MHGVNNQHQASIDTWWVCRGKRIFGYPSYYLGEYHSVILCQVIILLILGWVFLGMKFLGWYVDRQDIEFCFGQIPIPTCIKKMKFSSEIPEW